ncbi:MAG TPA: membrane protein insertase YidC, partial [Chitinophagaceae bacterium]
MKTDKNTIIGFVLLFVLFMLYFWYNNKQQSEYMAEKKRIEDSTARANAAKQPRIDTVQAKQDSVRLDSLNRVAAAGGFQAAATGTEQLAVVENDLMKVTFSSKGGCLKQVELKNFKSWDSTNVILGGPQQRLGYGINTDNRSVSTAELFFTAAPVTANPDGTKTITYSVTASDGRAIYHRYTIRPGDYMIDWTVELSGADRLLTQSVLNMEWSAEILQHQKDISYERTLTNLSYMEEGSYDFKRAEGGVDVSLENADWISYKQQFFNTTIIPKLKFESAKTVYTKQDDTSHALFAASTNMQVKVPAAGNTSVAFQLYYGPNDYRILKSYNNGMMNIVDLGSGIFSFVKYINRWIIMPVFNFFAGFILNYGWVIALLTLFIRLITSPLTYKSYLSGAKMKVLRPELDELKKKHGGDQQAFAMDQMKLFREAGVSPLGGCIPALLQIPIFFSLYSFFNANLALRGQNFLWADDLSQYDVIARLPFSIWGYGDHVSLFTLTAVVTSFMISIYNLSMTPTQDNPVLKYMPYIFPVVLLFIFNKLPSALTWYYTVSNIITLGLQFMIQNYIIDHDKILAEIERKRKEPKKKSKWAERMEQ